jgi:protein tyrosine phosphatase
MPKYKFIEGIDFWFNGAVRLLNKTIDKNAEGALDQTFRRYGEIGSTDNYTTETKSGLTFESSKVLKGSKIVKVLDRGRLDTKEYKYSLIATQCPKPANMISFLDKIYLSKIDAVISLTNEKKSSKAFHYWDMNAVVSGILQGGDDKLSFQKIPGRREVEIYCKPLYKYKIGLLEPFGGTKNVVTAKLIITPTDPDTIANNVNENKNLKKKYKLEANNLKPKTVDFYLYTNWPDQKVPATEEELNGLERLIMNIALFKRKPLVHCSAGVGRTGVFAACYESLKQSDTPDPVEIVRSMRKHRTSMVQSEEQFQLVCKFILRNRLGMNIDWTANIDYNTYLQYFNKPINDYRTFKADEKGRFGGIALYEQNLIPDYDDLPGLFDFVEHKSIRNVVILGPGGGFIEFFNSLENKISNYTIHTTILSRSSSSSSQSWNCTIEKKGGKGAIDVHFHYFNNFDSKGDVQHEFYDIFNELVNGIYKNARKNDMSPILVVSKEENKNFLPTFSRYLYNIAFDDDNLYAVGKKVLPHHRVETKKTSPKEKLQNAQASPPKLDMKKMFYQGAVWNTNDNTKQNAKTNFEEEQRVKINRYPNDKIKRKGH